MIRRNLLDDLKDAFRTKSAAKRGPSHAGRLFEALEQRVLLTAPVAADWDFGLLFTGETVSVDAADIVSELTPTDRQRPRIGP